MEFLIQLAREYFWELNVSIIITRFIEDPILRRFRLITFTERGFEFKSVLFHLPAFHANRNAFI